MANHFKEAGTIVGYPDSEPVAADLLFTLPVTSQYPPPRRRDRPGHRQVDVGVDRRGSGKRSTTGEGLRFSRVGASRWCPTSSPTRAALSLLLRMGPDLQATSGAELFHDRLEKTLREAFNYIWTRHLQLEVTLRETAIAVGVERIAEATELRGLFPDRVRRYVPVRHATFTQCFVAEGIVCRGHSPYASVTT